MKYTKGGNIMEAWGVILGLLGVLVLGIYLLNKISTRKANSFNLNTNNNFAQAQTEDLQNQQNR